MRRRANSVPGAIATIAALLSALAFFGELGWQVDLLAQFRLQMLLGGIVLLGVLALLRRPWAAAVALAAVGLNAHALYDVPVASRPADGAAMPLRLAAFNLLGNDRDIGEVVAWLRRERFDLVSFEELTPAFAAQLGALADLYPYRLMVPRKGGFGIGAMSRRPFISQETLFPDSPGRPVLRVGVDLDGTPVEIVVVHPPPPLSAAYGREPDAILARLAGLPPNPHRIVMGDFNAAPTSLALRRLMAAQGLREARSWPRLTWPSDLPWPLRLPIDHVLVGEGLLLLSVENGPALGSDHFPQIAVVAFHSID
jgi:endonuclease/exonuclease/phosphatase (EEP) superfamily protein YafD